MNEQMMAKELTRKSSPAGATAAATATAAVLMGEEEDQQRMKRMGMVVEEEEEEGEEGEEDGGRNAVRRDGPVTLRLLDATLWNAFRREGTEMIITKAGRRMFPFVMVKLEGLTPNLLYSVHLSLVPCDHRQYKFCQRRWIKASDVTPVPTPTPEQAYAHPASPNRGAYWCQEMISFAKLKITNNKHSQGDIVLQSMRKYMAQIIVREDQGDAEYVFPFPETTFVAVTQYQNEAVTRMKIAHNPFANGFKYAHVTGTEDGTKLFTRSELSRCQTDSRQKHTSSSSSKAKAARVKATLQRPTLTPLILNPHQPDDLKLVSSALSLPGAPQPLYFSPPLTLEAETGPGPCLSLPQILQGGFQIPSSVAVFSSYLFRSEEGESPDEEDVSLEKDLSGESSFTSSFKAEAYQEPETCPKSGGFRSRVEDAQGRDSEEETRDEDVIKSFSPTTFTTTPTSTALPTTVTDSDKSGATTLQPTISDNDEIHDRQTSFLTPLSKSSLSRVFSVSSSNTGVPTSLSKKGGLFKQPLPRRGAMLSARKAGKRGLAGDETGEESSSSSSSSSSSGAVAALESDTDRCSRATLHKVSHKHRKWAVKHDRGVQLQLHDGHIWHSFAACGSGMVLNAEGRNMFPVISISLRGLDPGRLYSVWLHVTAADAADVTCPSHPVRHPTLWPGPLLSGALRRPLPAAPSNVRPFMHPCSPMRGLAWMKVKVDFSEVKLTTLTSDSVAPVVAKDSLPLQGGRQYLTQIVVREEEEITPSGAGLWGNIYFFPLQEVTFVTKLETDVCQATLPVTSDNALSQPGKRRRDSCLEATTSEESDASTAASIPPAKVTRMDTSAGGGHWMKSPIVLPRHTDLTPLLSRPPDLASLLPRQPDLCNWINPLYCFPPFSTLPPSAHVRFLANRMPLPVTSPLQSITSFPYQPPPQLLPQLRSPMHSAFAAMPVPSATPFPYCYYPYALDHSQVALSNPSVASAVSEASQGLDLSLKSSDEIV